MIKGLYPAFLASIVFGISGQAIANDFTQKDLERIVKELDKVIPENPKYTYPIECSIQKGDDINAYATARIDKGKLQAKMVVWSGLVKAIDGDQRLLRAVVAHELSHLSRGHVRGFVPAAKDLRNLFTRQQEFEADKYGAQALVNAGYPKQDMVDMLLFLDRIQGRGPGWLSKLTSDHADPKARAAEVSDKPAALKALVTYDTALAYEDARNHIYAKKLFDLAFAQWSDLTEATINSAKCSLLYYYDNLPAAVRSAWWRPDFGPLITNPHAPAPQATEITDQDRDAYQDAVKAIKFAISKNPKNVEALALNATAQVLEPDAKKEVVESGIEWFKSNSASTKDERTRLRFANNAGVGMQRLNKPDQAYEFILNAQKGSDFFNSALGENLGLVKASGRTKAEDTLAAQVLLTWLSNTPPTSPRYAVVKKTFNDICSSIGIEATEIKQKPGYLCEVTTLFTSGFELGLLLPIEAFKKSLGEPEQTVTFIKDWPDFTEVHWHKDSLVVWTERDKVMRITSYEEGAYLLLRPVDRTLQYTVEVKVGMPKDKLFAMINEKASVLKDLARTGDVESWNYFPDLNMGVLIENDKVKAITVSPVQYEKSQG